jgi:serine/threonine-protein kinase
VRKSLDQIAGTIEIADNGPFFEQDWRVNGEVRAIRAAAGYRPALVVEAPRLQSVRTRPAVVTLDDRSHKTLILQGLDVVLRASDLPANQTAVFLCLGGELVLRDCTITIEGERETPLAVFQMGQAGFAAPATTGKLRLERTLIRCPGAVALRLAEGPASVQLVDSMILGGRGPVLAVSGGREPRRQIDVVRSVFASPCTIVELAGAVATADARPPELRLLDSALIHLGDGSASLVAERDVPGRVPTDRLRLTCKGQGNTLIGWSEETAAALADAGATVLPASEPFSTSPPPHGWSEPDSLLARLGEVPARHCRVTRPRANLQSWTLQAFPLLEPAAPLSGGPGAQRLVFDADDSRLNGDLGRYLAEAVDPQARAIQLEVRGNGRKWVTPFALRPGLSLQMVVAPTPPGGEPLLFVPRETAEGDALIFVRDAALSLVGAQFERDARPVLKHLIRVEHGRLRLERCTIRAPMQVEPEGGNLIAFETAGTRPLLGIQPDTTESRPEWISRECLFMTGGRLCEASVGRGLIRFEQCTLVAGAVVFLLNQQAVSPTRFEADVQLERCTVVAERDVVRFRIASGGSTGPQRPWVIATRGCALFDAFDRGPAPSTTVLLRSDPQALARGSVVWQSDHDAYAVSQFVTTGAVDQTPTSFLDLRRDWVSFWGESHVIGPVEAKGLIRLGRERLRPGAVEPRDVVVRPLNPRGPALALGADASVIESEIPISKPTLPRTDPTKTGPIK